MSHRFDGPEGTHFEFNSDLSGDVEITRGEPRLEETMWVPGNDMRAFIAEYVRRQKIAALEEASVESLLGIAPEAAGEGERKRGR